LQAAATVTPNLPPYSAACAVPGPVAGTQPGAQPGGAQWLPRPSVVTPGSGPSADTMPQLPTVPTMSVSTVASNKPGGGDDVNFDDLARRFEELKKRK